MSSIAKVPTCVTLPPDLLARVDRIAEADERSRSFIVAKALQAFCDSQPGASTFSSALETAGKSGTAAGAGTSRLPVAASSQLAAASITEATSAFHAAVLERHVGHEAQKAATTSQGQADALRRSAEYIAELGEQ